MGRLIRKKAPGKKKIKPVSQESPSSAEQGSDASQAQAVKSSAASGDAKAKKVIPIMRRNAVATKAVAGKQKKNVIDKSMQFLREVKIELKKVTWPSRKQTLGSTAVVIILVMIISLFLGMVDFGLSSLIRVILQ